MKVALIGALSASKSIALLALSALCVVGAVRLNELPQLADAEIAREGAQTRSMELAPVVYVGAVTDARIASVEHRVFDLERELLQPSASVERAVPELLEVGGRVARNSDRTRAAGAAESFKPLPRWPRIPLQVAPPLAQVGVIPLLVRSAAGGSSAPRVE